MPKLRLPVLVTTVGLLAAMLSVVGLSTASASTAATASTQERTATTTASSSRAGAARLNYVIPAGSYFSYPNRGRAAKMAIRNRVLATIKSTWGGPRLANGLPGPNNGTIRIATWSFKDWAIARALVAARDRGVSVQVVAAAGRNAENAQWRFLRRKFGTRLFRKGQPGTANQVSFARACRGSCRGRGGTPHAKYFLFTNVGASHVPATVIQTSMNLTPMGYSGQWNQAEATHRQDVYDDFLSIFKQARLNVPQRVPHHLYTTSDGVYTDEFFPFHANRTTDPVMRMLSNVQCSNAGVGTTGNKTRIRIIQYSLYGERGVWIAKRLRQLSGQGCDIRVIYAVSTREVVSILRNNSGGDAIPMRQSVITDAGRVIVKYNHSKWMTIMGNIGGKPGQYKVMTGSSNWSLFAFSSDEQLQVITSGGGYDARPKILRYNGVFNTTWNQRTSHQPGFGIKGQEGRFTEAARIASIPQTITWGKGIYKYLSPNGD
jgi:phosphatidylserine/phosphatidylglycerophosphate/cardiolipin synthase-like enzyme